MQEACEACLNRASKLPGGACDPLAKQMCVRRMPSEIGPVFDNTVGKRPKRLSCPDFAQVTKSDFGIVPASSKLGHLVRAHRWHVAFDAQAAPCAQLEIAVQEQRAHPQAAASHMNRLAQSEPRFVLERPTVPEPDAMVRWSANYAPRGRSSSLHAALDNFMASFAQRGYRFPQVSQRMRSCLGGQEESLHDADSPAERPAVEGA